MGNLERLPAGPGEARDWFDVAPGLDLPGNMPAGDVYPRQAKPIIRRRETGERELVMMNWDFPYAGGKK